jgi:hypothetical protein
VVSGGIGLVALGFGVGFGLEAVARMNERQQDCSFNYCTHAGYALTNDARDAATASTIAFAAAGGGFALGTALFLLGPRTSKGVGIVAGVQSGGAGLRVEGDF